jgi:hypothetical protein
MNADKVEHGSRGGIISFKGRVLPEVRKVSIPHPLKIAVDDPIGVKGIFHIVIFEGIIAVRCEVSNPPNNCLSLCLVKAYEIIGVPINLLAFSKGWSLSVILDESVENEIVRPVVLSECSVQKYVTALENADDFEKITDVLFSKFNLRFAVQDLILSLSAQNYSAIAAARAVEAIRYEIVADQTSDKDAWRIMREKLQIDETFLKFVTGSSKKPRHGDRGATDGQIQMEVTHRAWAIMNRYLEYIKRGESESLPIESFPILTGSCTYMTTAIMHGTQQ